MPESLKERIREILTQLWNPIGINLPPEDDEYDSYIPPLLQRAWSEMEIRDYLLKLVEGPIGMKNTKDQRRKTDEATRLLYEILKQNQ